MPKCLLNSVRGYRTGTYIGESDYDPNVMTTRSGRSIRKVSIGIRNGNRVKCSPLQETRKPKPNIRKYPIVKYKSMSYMSFVTRFQLGLRVPDLELAGVNPQETVYHLEDYQYDYRNDRVYSCSGDENQDSAQSEELGDNYSWESDDAFNEDESKGDKNEDGSMDDDFVDLDVDADNDSENDDDDDDDDGDDDGNQTDNESSDEDYNDVNSKQSDKRETTNDTPHVIRPENSSISMEQYRMTLDEKIRESRQGEGPNSILLNSPRIQSSSGVVTVKPAAAHFHNQIRPAVVVQLHPKDACRPPLRCEDCKRDFSLMSAYTAHLKTHTKQRNKCNICGKIFTRSWLLKGHMRTHTGERPFRCPHEHCDKAFADKSNLRSHMMIHSVTSKNFTCQKCGRAFAQKRYLHKHLLEVCRILT